MKPLSTQQRELLLRLTHQPVDSYLAQVWNPIVGSLESWVSYFVAQGLLEEATLAEKFAASHSLEQFKELAKKHGLKSSGKKEEVAHLIFSSLSKTAIKAETRNLRLYHATLSGQQIITAYQQERITALHTAENEALQHILRGQLPKAEETVGHYLTTYEFLQWGNTSIQGYRELKHHEAAFFLAYQYLDLEMSESLRKLFAVQLTLSTLFNEALPKSSKRLYDSVGDAFVCHALTVYLQTSHGSYTAGFKVDDTRKVIELYVHTKTSEAYAKESLTLFYSHHVGKGIQIIPAEKDTCKICNVGKLTYSWRETKDIPIIPRHWGCRCVYAAWV